jgi:hypothetical protein
MSNSTIFTVAPSKSLVTSYYSLSLIIVGTILNLLTFVTLCRSKFRDKNRRPTLHYMRTIAIIDIFMLYGWNLDHYLWNLHGYTLLLYSIPTCKIFLFLDYFPVQTSAWLRIFLCIDRYLLLSRPRRTWFGHSKNVLIIIVCIISIFTLFNLDIVIFCCFYDTSGSIDPDSPFYSLNPLWNYIDLVIYNCIPFVLMIFFNSKIIYYLIQLRQTSSVQNSQIQHRAITITLVITTFLFLVMTIPSNVAYACFITVADPTLLELLNSLLYTYHITSFPLYFITLREFRQEFIDMILFKNRPTRIQPSRPTPPAIIGQL